MQHTQSTLLHVLTIHLSESPSIDEASRRITLSCPQHAHRRGSLHPPPCRSCLWYSKFGDLSEDMLEAYIVRHTLGDALHGVGVHARAGCGRMDYLAPNGNREGHLGRAAIFG